MKASKILLTLAGNAIATVFVIALTGPAEAKPKRKPEPEPEPIVVPQEPRPSQEMIDTLKQKYRDRTPWAKLQAFGVPAWLPQTLPGYDKSAKDGVFGVYTNITTKVTPLANISVQGNVQCYKSEIRARPYERERENSTGKNDPLEHIDSYGFALPVSCPTKLNFSTSLDLAIPTLWYGWWAKGNNPRNIDVEVAVEPSTVDQSSFHFDITGPNIIALLQAVTDQNVELRDHLEKITMGFSIPNPSLLKDADGSTEVQNVTEQLLNPQARRTNGGTVISGTLNTKARSCRSKLSDPYAFGRRTLESRESKPIAEWNLCFESAMTTVCGYGIVNDTRIPYLGDRQFTQDAIGVEWTNWANRGYVSPDELHAIDREWTSWAIVDELTKLPQIPESVLCWTGGNGVRADPARSVTLASPPVEVFIPDTPAGAKSYLRGEELWGEGRPVTHVSTGVNAKAYLQ